MNTLNFQKHYLEGIIIVIFLCAISDALCSMTTSLVRNSGLFMRHAKNDEAPAIQKAIVNGMPVDIVDHIGSSALYYAAENKNISLAQFLIQRRSTVNLRNKNGQTPLHRAVRDERPEREKQSMEMVKLLLQSGADCTVADLGGSTPLDYALKGGFPSVVQILIAHQTTNCSIAVPGLPPPEIPPQSNMEDENEISSEVSDDVFPECGNHSLRFPYTRSLLYKYLKNNDLSLATHMIVLVALTDLADVRKEEAYAMVNKVLRQCNQILHDCLGYLGNYSHIDRICSMNDWRTALMIIFFDELNRSILVQSSIVSQAQKYASYFLGVQVGKILQEFSLFIAREKPLLITEGIKVWLSESNLKQNFQQAISQAISSKLLSNSFKKEGSQNFHESTFYKIALLEKAYYERYPSKKKDNDSKESPDKRRKIAEEKRDTPQWAQPHFNEHVIW